MFQIMISPSEISHKYNIQLCNKNFKYKNCYVTEPNDIADAVIFLLSDYSKMVNGLNLYVDGGFMTG